MLPALPALIATAPWTAALKTKNIRSELFSLEFTEIEPVYDGFPRVVRGDFAVAELALATFIQAYEAGAALRLLPIALSQRVQHPSLVRHVDRPLEAGQLAGRRIAVRSYAQTTAVWVRGLLLDRYGVAPSSVEWITFEDGHVPGAKDPPNCTRAPTGSNILDLLERGEVDAAIFGSNLPAKAWLAPVIHDLPSDRASWQQLMGYVPINHGIVVSSQLVRQNPHFVPELISLFAASRSAAADNENLPVCGLDAFKKPVCDCTRYLMSQGLITRAPEFASLFAGQEC